MSTKGRVKFTIWGHHPHLHFLRNNLIHKGFALVDYDDNPEFVLVGGIQDGIIDEYALRDVPVLLLSDDCVYSDRDFNFDVRDKLPMKEDDPIFIPSSLEPEVWKTLNFLQAEHEFLTSSKHRTMVLRIFPVYGPNIDHGLIHTYARKVRDGEALPLFSPGYHSRTYLHETDFLEVFNRLLERFLDGHTGIFNVGAEEETSIKRLADSVWQLYHGPKSEVEIVKLRSSRCYRWWLLPDLTRTKALTNWKPKVTLRTGLWELLQ